MGALRVGPTTVRAVEEVEEAPLNAVTFNNNMEDKEDELEDEILLE